MTKKAKKKLQQSQGGGDLTARFLCKYQHFFNGCHSFLVIYLNNLFSFQVHVDHLRSCLQQRLHFLCRLRVIGVNQKAMLVFNQVVLESILRYGMLW